MTLALISSTRSLISLTLGYHLKTGHQLSLQNRPTNHTQDQMLFYRVGRQLGKYFPSLNASSRYRRGIAQGGFQRQRFEIPLAGGAGARLVTAGFAGTRRVPAWGEPSPPRLSPWGKRERGIKFLAAVG